MNKWPVIPLVFLAATIGCEQKPPPRTDASAFTVESNRRLAETLDFSDRQAFADAEQGLVAAAEPAQVNYPNIGGPQHTLAAWQFLDGDPPPTVNPSLWRQAQLNNRAGLYKVTDGVYQLRGFDVANMTLIQGSLGWVVVDPLTAATTARAALFFAHQHLGKKPVTAIIFTHSHVDHFGGVLGIINEDQVAQGQIPIVAPEGFMEAATKENLLAGPAMVRRVSYVYGQRLEAEPTGNVGLGLGKALAFEAAGILPPTHGVRRTGEKLVLDGVPIEFQMVPESEAPAEFTFYLPEHKAFCGAEIVSQTMHNLYTLRGARVRDALAWSNYIDEAIRLFPDAKVYFGSHHWPVWGKQQVVEFLEGQRDLYKYIHDQTLRLANAGLTPGEIAEELVLPESMSRQFSSRGYYGSLKHNIKAVYQFYFGWYDGNPANLDPLPPEAAAKRYVELAGGPEQLMSRAQESFNKGDYRWTAELLNHLVFARPDHGLAKRLLAETYRQLAYQAESTQWRNSYLVAALELESGVQPGPSLMERASEAMMLNTPVGGFFDVMAVRLNGPKAADKHIVFNVTFSDLERSYVLEIKNGVLHHWQRDPSPTATATLIITHEMFVKMLLGRAGLRDVLFSDDVNLEGSKLGAVRFLRLFEQTQGNFNIVTP